MKPIQTQLSDLAIAAAAAAQAAGDLPAFELPASAPINVPKQAGAGDYSTALAMQLAKLARKKPLEIASALAAHWPNTAMVATVTAAPPGFVNIHLSGAWLGDQVAMILREGPRFADQTSGQGIRANVEYVSANPTGPLTVGRIRGGVIGDTVANVLDAAGYDVSREYYFNNAGQQMIKLGDSLRLRYLQALGEDVELGEEHYRGDYLIAVAEQVLADHGDSLRDSDWQPFKEIAEAAMFANIKASLARLNISHDVFFNENTLLESNAVWDVVEKLKANGLAYEQDGAVWFKTTEFGAEQDRVLVRSNGVPTYRLPDIAYHVNKLDRGFDLAIDVLGADHKDAFPDVVNGVRSLGYNADGIRLVMNQFVTFRGERMSTRAGNFVTLDELVDEVGADVVRFFMLMRAAESHLEFDLDLALEQSEQNPVYYVQYAHARVSSILRKAADEGFGAAGDPRLLTHGMERALILKLLELAEIIDRAVTDLAPHHLTNYARELAASFHQFYQACHVLDANNPDLSAARLMLVQASQITLARTLGLIGVSAPERM